jgi:hypothetical protein
VNGLREGGAFRNNGDFSASRDSSEELFSKSACKYGPVCTDRRSDALRAPSRGVEVGVGSLRGACASCCEVCQAAGSGGERGLTSMTVARLEFVMGRRDAMLGGRSDKLDDDRFARDGMRV